MANDKDLKAFIELLERHGWVVKSNPYDLQISGMQFYIDLEIVSATQKFVLVDLKTFHGSVSRFTSEILGTYLKYQEALEKADIAIPLFIAITWHNSNLLNPFIKELFAKYKVSLVIYDLERQTLQWEV
jgi:hypothetical protein